MKKFTKQEIDGTRTYFEQEGFPEVRASLGEHSFSYFVLPQELEPKLQGFVMRMTGEQSDGYVLGIADSVKEKFRPYAVAHEFIEFTKIGIDQPDRCVRALEKELELVPEKYRQEYIPMRRAFFKKVIDYAKTDDSYSEEDVSEFRKSLQRLEELCD